MYVVHADDLTVLTNTPAQAECVLLRLEQVARGIGLYLNSYKAELICFNQDGAIFTLSGKSQKLVSHFTELSSNILSTDMYRNYIDDMEIWYCC